MKKSAYIALAAIFGLTLGASSLARAEGVYGGAYADRPYYSGNQTDRDPGMTNPALTNNLDQGRYDNRATIDPDQNMLTPSIDRTYSDRAGKYSYPEQTGDYTSNPGDREGTSWDVGMTHPQFTDNMDQGRLDNRGLIRGRDIGTPGLDRRYTEQRQGAPRDLREVRNLVGMEVLDANGNRIGTIQDLVADDLGRIDFAVLNTDTKDIAVPFQALNYDGMGHYTLNLSQDQLASAPAFDRMYLADRAWPDQVYRYYGLQPRW